jgi:RimJ/RimL family protein N-acetyltransferase
MFSGSSLSDQPPEILETKRLRLRKPVLQDAEEIFRKYVRDPEVTRYLTRWSNASVDETRDVIRGHQKAWDEGKSFHWVIVRKEDDRLLGTITARVTDHKWELGYVLARSYWGRGYMTEAVKKMLDWAFKAKGDLSCLVGLRCGQYWFGTSDGESKYTKRRHSAPLVGTPEYQSRAEGCLQLRDHKVNLLNDNGR